MNIAIELLSGATQDARQLIAELDQVLGAVASNDAPQGRAQNRRIELVVEQPTG